MSCVLAATKHEVKIDGSRLYTVPTVHYLFEGDWCVRFPRNLQQAGAKFVVDGLIPNEKYSFYRWALHFANILVYELIFLQ